MCIRQSEYLLLAREIWPRAHARTPYCAPCPTRARASCATSTRHAPRPCVSPASPCQFISTVHAGGAGPSISPWIPALLPGAPSRRSYPGAPSPRTPYPALSCAGMACHHGKEAVAVHLFRIAAPVRQPRKWPIMGCKLCLRACTL
jgi:hypothetical protein